MWPQLQLPILLLLTHPGRCIRMHLMSSLLISTWNYTDANLQAWSILQQGRHRTRQAVIQGCLGCLGIRCGRQLGGGSGPNELGQLSLEAAIMDGENLNYGAVAGIEGVRNAILVADSVLRHTKHTLLVGKSATLFARSMGYKEQNSPNGDTEQSMWGWRFNGCQPNYWRDVRPLETSRCGPYHPLPENLLRHPMRQEYPIIQDEHDQIAMLALDAEGRIHVASQASGSRFRIAGRVGDSAVPGAGIYADNKVGGALATGDGDVLMRLLPAFLAVEALRDGQKPAQAAKKVIQRVLKYHTEFNGAVIVVTRWGTYAAACAGMDEFNFVVSGGKSHLSMARVERVKCQNRENEIVDGGPRGRFLRKPIEIWNMNEGL